MGSAAWVLSSSAADRQPQRRRSGRHQGQGRQRGHRRHEARRRGGAAHGKGHSPCGRPLSCRRGTVFMDAARAGTYITLRFFSPHTYMCRKHPEGISPRGLRRKAHWPVLPYTLLGVHGLGRGAEGDALHIHGRPPPARTCRPWPRRDLLVLRAAADGSDADCWQRRVAGHGRGVL